MAWEVGEYISKPSQYRRTWHTLPKVDDVCDIDSTTNCWEDREATVSRQAGFSSPIELLHDGSSAPKHCLTCPGEGSSLNCQNSVALLVWYQIRREMGIG